MNSEIYDVAIIGGGVAGAFALTKLNQLDSKLKIAMFEAGRPPMKRRHQIFGWLGCLPGSDGKLYLDNVDTVSEIIGARKAKSAYTVVEKILGNIKDNKIIKSKDPAVSCTKKINKLGYTLSSTDYIQITPKEIHLLSKSIAQKLESNKNIDYIFDEEVESISKDKKYFTIRTECKEEFKCKKLLLCVGRGGWKWAHQIFSNFGIVQNNSIGKYGIKIETDAINLKDLNYATAILSKDNVSIGRFCWNGTVIPEDHGESAVAAFRSNEVRWQTDKVSFNLIGSINFENNAVEQIDRISNLTFLLANDRVTKEKLSLLKSKKSKISIMKEYDWLAPYLEELESLFPGICEKSNFYYPTIVPMTSQINVYSNLETDVENLYVAGESAGVEGILSAMLTGVVAAEKIIK